MIVKPMIDLQQRSIEIIRGWQFDGAYAACLSFSQYGYSWLRDGAWIANGMAAAGQTSSARAFYQWGARTLWRYRAQVDSLLAKLARGEALLESDYLPTRFKLDGDINQDDWPNFQLDGYGAWLWGLVQFVQAHDDQALWVETRPAVRLTVEYLGALWQSPNYDSWEEHRDHIHPSTLAALYGGFRAVEAQEFGIVPAGLADRIRDFVLTHALAPAGHVMKYLGNDAVDANLLWLAVPYRLLELDDPRFQATLAKIERDIHRPGGGVYRYQKDTYYGGGEWLLLTLWLAWVYLERGQPERARPLIDWAEAQATSTGEMPEQVGDHVLDSSMVDFWINRWGTSASPLLWSHGMYLLLKSKLKD